MLPDRLIRQMSAHTGPIHAVKFTSDGNYCMSCSDDRTVILCNPHRDGHESNEALHIKTYSGVHGYQILDIAISKDNSKFASVGGDKIGFLWDISSGRVLRRFQGHKQRINTAAMNNEGTVLLTGSYDKTILIWDLRSNTRDAIQTLSDFKDSVTSVLSTSNEIIAGCVDGNIRTYDIRNGRCHTDELADPITSINVSHDQRCLLSTCLGGQLRMTEISSGKLLQSYEGHQHKSFKIESQITNDDAHVISGSEDGNIYFWDLVRGNIVKQFHSGHSDVVSSISYHPNQPLFLSSSFDSIIKLWGI